MERDTYLFTKLPYSLGRKTTCSKFLMLRSWMRGWVCVWGALCVDGRTRIRVMGWKEIKTLSEVNFSILSLSFYFLSCVKYKIGSRVPLKTRQVSREVIHNETANLPDPWKFSPQKNIWTSNWRSKGQILLRQVPLLMILLIWCLERGTWGKCSFIQCLAQDLAVSRHPINFCWTSEWKWIHAF